MLVEALEKTGVLAALADLLRRAAAADPATTAWAGGAVVAFGSNLVNNLRRGCSPARRCRPRTSRTRSRARS